jgi:hypothetical protein
MRLTLLFLLLPLVTCQNGNSLLIAIIQRLPATLSKVNSFDLSRWTNRTFTPHNITLKSNETTMIAGDVILLLPYSVPPPPDGEELKEYRDYAPDQISLDRFRQEGHAIQLFNLENIEQVHTASIQYSEANGIKLYWKPMPEEIPYSEYLQQIKDACKNNQTGLFDVVYLDATSIGELSGCLTNLWEYDQTITAGIDSGLVENGFVRNVLYSVPAGTFKTLFHTLTLRRILV